MQYRRHVQAQGLTLIEMLIVIALLAVLAGMTVPTFSTKISYYRLNRAARQVVADLMAARQRAISHQASVQVLFAPPDSYTIWDDTNANGDMDHGEIHSHNLQQYHITLAATNNPTFHPRGAVTNFATIMLTGGTSAREKRCIRLSIAGRITSGTCPQ